MARITPLHLLPALIAAASHAGEVTIEHRPFVMERSFKAIILPLECTPLQVQPKNWTDFKILEIAPHAAKVKAGQVLVRFDTDSIDEKIADARTTLVTADLAVAQAESDLRHLEETSPHKLEAARRTAEIAREDHAEFVKARRAASEESAAQQLKRSEQLLSNQREELRQLTKMYKADDLTEETEEIILVRQEDAVAAAEFALRMEMLDHKRTLEVTLPREAKRLADAERDSAAALRKAESDIPRALSTKKAEVDSLRTAKSRATKAIAALEADRNRFEIKAPADGWFYHGPIENGKWSSAEASRLLVPRSAIPPHRSFATFIPASATPAMIAMVDEETQRSLKEGQSGMALLPGREDLELAVKLTTLAAAPSTDGQYRADLTLTWPDQFHPAFGSSADVRLITREQAKAIVVPTRALTLDQGAWSVEVRLADGKTERRHVDRGATTRDETEIIAGLEVGQVVVVPDK